MIPTTELKLNFSNASSGTLSAPAPKRLAFDSPVRYQSAPAVTTSADTISGTVHSGATQSSSTTSAPAVSLSSQVPKLFKSSVEPAFSSTQETPAPATDESSGDHSAEGSQEQAPSVQAVPSSPVTYSLATSSAARISPGQSLFGKSAPVAAPSMLEKKTALGHFYPIIGEHLLREQLLRREQFVLGSDRSRTEQSDSAGESRDSGSGMPVSSSDGRRKRTATNESSTCESKRHRDSPSEVVTSSEERRDLDVVPESGTVVAADMEVMDVPDDAEGDDDIEVLEEGHDDSVQHIELLSDEDVSEQSMDDFDEDEDDGGMESDEEIDNGDSADVVILSDGEDGEEIGGVEMEDDHGDDELDDGEGLVEGQDDEALAADDNSLDAPAHSGDFVDDEDREAASAVEEADDEGRTDTGSAGGALRHPNTSSMSASSGGGSSQPQTARLRIPIVYGAEDQCSSSNESGAAQFGGRRRRPIGLYQAGVRHAAPSSAEPPAERLSVRMRGRARAALRGRGKGRGAMH
ncbi:unnamed protein product [Heligmosomoides polygyrus]|uniref:HSF_DOMAIN domain-containing protein n=1 Tax=Heligmosomoides polygyrus TaxID=6339 RepID=A0A183GU31_HELPZ|nr:unnamed protein product [Heligmosomoides polygyrus]